ncbi:MAG TPA: hypothetical protein VMM59_10075 [Thermohalobaculum sp.]|nr:hypothetical protein [Thermohalobaculum sp.]
MKIHVIHENAVWTAPLFRELAARGLPYEDWHLDAGLVEPQAPPPDGVFYNRMSASSHARGHRYAPELTGHVLGWLAAHGRRTVNGPGAIALEVSKLAQYAALGAHGIATPRTIGAVGREAVLRAARALGRAPFILKPNRGGAGAGVQVVRDADELAAILDDPATVPPLDGTWLVQDYVEAAEPAITRCELIGGRFHYAVRVNTSAGFELCPADACDLPDGRERFEIIPGFDDPLIARYRAFAAANGIDVTGIEFIRDGSGRALTYDVNTNTNYNSAAEAKAGVQPGMARLAEFLGEELARARRAA